MFYFHNEFIILGLIPDYTTLCISKLQTFCFVFTCYRHESFLLKKTDLVSKVTFSLSLIDCIGAVISFDLYRFREPNRSFMALLREGGPTRPLLRNARAS